MRLMPWTGFSTVVVLSLLVGAGFGAAVVVSATLPSTAPLAISLASLGAGYSPSLGCSLEGKACVNVSISFTGASTLDPALLGLSVALANGSLLVGSTEYRALNLTYFAKSNPQWMAQIGSGTYSSYFQGSAVNPGGRPVGDVYSTDGTVSYAALASGATLTLEGPAAVLTGQGFVLTLRYLGETVSEQISTG